MVASSSRGTFRAPLTLPTGCRFRTRCPHAVDICMQLVPEMREVKPGHWAACHLYDDDPRKPEVVQKDSTL
jgi:oligopeptide transport system ATP-binding protein